MTNKAKLRERTVSGLRTRFYPKNRIGQGLISVAPWVDVVFLVVFFLMVSFRFVLQPGFVVDLPEATFDQGSRLGLAAFVLSTGKMNGGGMKEIVFFDDERFILKRDDQIEKLKKKFSACVKEGSNEVLAVLADKRVSHGTIVKIVEIARQAGFSKVNVGIRSF
ncbi:biopolymer transporter ExbD [Verrucomicrobiota bacterium]